MKIRVGLSGFVRKQQEGVISLSGLTMLLKMAFPIQQEIMVLQVNTKETAQREEDEA
ncbi:hypothetical protein HK096_000188, partial [Nowakowskiella sp. JEL0078]